MLPGCVRHGSHHRTVADEESAVGRKRGVDVASNPAGTGPDRQGSLGEIGPVGIRRMSLHNSGRTIVGASCHPEACRSDLVDECVGSHDQDPRTHRQLFGEQPRGGLSTGDDLVGFRDETEIAQVRGDIVGRPAGVVGHIKVALIAGFQCFSCAGDLIFSGIDGAVEIQEQDVIAVAQARTRLGGLSRDEFRDNGSRHLNRLGNHRNRLWRRSGLGKCCRLGGLVLAGQSAFFELGVDALGVAQLHEPFLGVGRIVVVGGSGVHEPGDRLVTTVGGQQCRRIGVEVARGLGTDPRWVEVFGLQGDDGLVEIAEIEACARLHDAHLGSLFARECPGFFASGDIDCALGPAQSTLAVGDHGQQGVPT